MPNEMMHVTGMELVSLMYALGIEDMPGVYDPLYGVKDAEQEGIKRTAIDGLMEKGYLQHALDGEHIEASLDALWMLAPTTRARRYLRVERRGEERLQSIVYYVGEEKRVMQMVGSEYRFLEVNGPETALSLIASLMTRGMQLPEYAVDGRFKVPAQSIRVWHTSIDRGLFAAGKARLIAEGVPPPWAEHMSRCVSQPLFRGYLNEGLRDAAGEMRIEAYSLLLSPDGVAYELHDAGKDAIIRVRAGRAVLAHLAQFVREQPVA